ncbi:MAG: hypothetical protein ACE5DN_03595 [Flavobacteriales bacterium]
MLLFVTFSACKTSVQQEHPPLARVGDNYLYPIELAGIVPPGSEQGDSIRIVKAYIRNWTEQQLLLQKAQLNLSKELKDVEKKLEEYRKSLLIYNYEKQIIAQMLDTVVTDSEIVDYYNANQKNFELKDYIVKVTYGKFDKNAPKLKQARNFFNMPHNSSRDKLREYCLQYSVNYFLEDSVWLYLDDVLREVPIEIFNKEKFLKSRKYVEFEDENFIYMLRLLDYKLKNSTSPLSLERNAIISNILNHRKVELIRKLKTDILRNAMANNECEIY